MDPDKPLPRLSYHFDISDPVKSAKVILNSLRPEFHNHLQNEQLIVKSLSGGVNNHLLVAYFPSDTCRKTVIRANGAETDSMIDREAEIRLLLTLHKYHCYGIVYGVFENGLCYEYITGEALTLDTIQDDHINRMVIREKVKLHCLYRYEDIEKTQKSMDLFDRMYGLLSLVPASYKARAKEHQFLDYYPDCQQLFSREIELLKTHLTAGVTQSPIVFCHNDLYCSNILYDPKKDRVRFIDFEFAGLNYQAYDLANYFNEFAGVEDCDFSRYPDRNFQLAWLRCYLENWNEAHGLTEEITDQAVEELYVTVNKFSLATHLFWILWSLVQAQHSKIDFDYMRYGKVRFDEYNRRKTEFLDLNARNML